MRKAEPPPGAKSADEVTMKDRPVDSPYEDKEIRCPKLGGPVTFSYCKMETGTRPCSRALACWTVHFDAESYFRENLSDAEYRECFEKPAPSRVTTLLELVEQARKLAEQKRESDS